MKKTYYHIEQSTPAGWWKIIDKKTGACMDNVRGYAEALKVYRRLNAARREAKSSDSVSDSMPGSVR